MPVYYVGARFERIPAIGGYWPTFKRFQAWFRNPLVVQDLEPPPLTLIIDPEDRHVWDNLRRIRDWSRVLFSEGKSSDTVNFIPDPDNRFATENMRRLEKYING